MTKPDTQIFVDVDGVINAQPDSAIDLTAWPASTWQVREIFLPGVGHGDLTWSTSVIDHLHAIELHPTVEMCWLTTWQDLVHDHLCPHIGIGADWPVAMDGAEVRDGPLDWWKATRVRQALRQSSDRVVWIDDDITSWEAIQVAGGREDALAWLYTDRVLATRPETRSGLTPEHFDQIEEFLC